MKLYTFPGAPNPLRVDLLLAEKAIVLQIEKIDLTTREQLSPEYRRKNPNCDLPMLELDSGQYISQVPAICQYIDATFPLPPMFGETPEQRAGTIMWDHLAYQNGVHAVADVLRNSSKSMENRALVGPHNYAQIPALIERGRKRVRDYFNDLNDHLKDNEYLAGEYFSMADITGWVSIYFAGWIKEAIRPEHSNLKGWYENIAIRPTFTGTLKQE